MNTFKLTRSATSIGIALLIGSGLGAQVAAQNGDVALATIEATEGNTVSGTVRFIEQAHSTKIEIELAGLEPGIHGIHVHEFGNCAAADGSSAGGHFSPGDDPHGSPQDDAESRHAGDLGNVVADENGRVQEEKFSDELDFFGSYDVVGRAIIVHANMDDLDSQPSGDAGARVGCGVIEAVES